MRGADIRGVVVGLGAILFGQFILIESIPLVWRGYRSESWPETKGIVGRVHESFVYYRYEVGGEKQYGAEWIPTNVDPKGIAEDDLIPVYFDPDMPSVSRIQRGIDQRHFWAALMGAGIFVLGIFGCWSAIAKHIASRFSKKSIRQKPEGGVPPASPINDAALPNEHIRSDRGNG